MHMKAVAPPRTNGLMRGRGMARIGYASGCCNGVRTGAESPRASSPGLPALLPKSERSKLAVRAVAGSETVIDLAARHGVNRKFVYAQKGRASDALNDASCSAIVDDAS